MYQTSDGGRTWTTVTTSISPAAAHSPHARYP
jgi:hypothetical protein